MTQPDEVERPLEPWKYVYVASALDFGASVTANIKKDESRLLGYTIIPKIRVANQHKNAIVFLIDFCEEHNIVVNESKRKGNIQITNTDSIVHLLKLVQPYLLAKREISEILIDDLIPQIKGGMDTKGDFIETVKLVDKIREGTNDRGKTKYDEQFFREEWNL
jgi:hypothetical protein